MSRFFIFCSYGVLLAIIFYLIYLIMSGTFCYCQKVKCPNSNTNSYQSYIGVL